MFWLTELVSAFSTMPPRNIVKFCAIPCTVHTRCVLTWCASAFPESTAPGQGSQPSFHVAADWRPLTKCSVMLFARRG